MENTAPSNAHVPKATPPSERHGETIDESSFLDDSVLSQMMDEVEHDLATTNGRDANSQASAIDESSVLDDSVLSQMMDEVEHVLTPPSGGDVARGDSSQSQSRDSSPGCRLDDPQMPSSYATPIAAQRRRRNHGSQNVDDYFATPGERYRNGVATVTPNRQGHIMKSSAAPVVASPLKKECSPRNPCKSRESTAKPNRNSSPVRKVHSVTVTPQSCKPSRNSLNKSRETVSSLNPITVMPPKTQALQRNPYKNRKTAGEPRTVPKNPYPTGRNPSSQSVSNQEHAKKSTTETKVHDSNASSSQGSLISEAPIIEDLSGGLDDSILCGLMDNFEHQTEQTKASSPGNLSRRLSNDAVDTTRKRLKFSDV